MSEYVEHKNGDMCAEYLQEATNSVKMLEEQVLRLGCTHENECEMDRSPFVTFESTQMMGIRCV